jgi:hypothetical protein
VTVVSLFTGLELLAVGAALLVFARHAGDRETITLTHREMSVVQQVGPAVELVRFRAEWVRVEPVADDGSLVELSGEGRSVRVGRHVRPEMRVALALGSLAHAVITMHELIEMATYRPADAPRFNDRVRARGMALLPELVAVAETAGLWSESDQRAADVAFRGASLWVRTQTAKDRQTVEVA